LRHWWSGRFFKESPISLNKLFLGENHGNLYKFARTVIDAGEDIALGNSLHVTRVMDIYKGKFIAYSLGNFGTYRRLS
jgi:hypothetical protein